jgi:hypothetical protein
MRMAFDAEDELAYFACRDELCTRFADWAQRQQLDADAGDVELLLDWKWGYSDGRLDHWDGADVEEFLLGWCPRKVASPPDLIKSIPGSVGAYVDFLAHEGLLAPGCSPSVVRRACADLGPRFDREMTDPANFGMAKSLLGGFGDADPNALLEQLARLTGTSAEEVLESLDDAGPAVVGPVEAPTEDEVAAAIAKARMFAQVRGLAERCGPAGLALTAKGNLRVADARRLTLELETGEAADTPDRRLGSAAELPYLSWLVDTALAAGAVRRLRGRLVAVARFGERSDRDAYKRTVLGALEAGLGSPMSWAWAAAPPDSDGLAVALLAELLDSGAAGASVDDLAEQLGPLLGGYGPMAAILGGSTIDHQLARLADLGLVILVDDTAAVLTAAGRAVGAEIVTEAGIEVVYRADPTTAGADELVASLLLLDEDDAAADLGAWAAAHPACAAELTTAATHADLAPVAVLSLLEMAGSTALGTDIDRAAETHRDGPHGPLVTMWLLLRGAIEASSVDPDLMLVGTVEVAAAMIDDAGPEGVVEFFGSDVEQTLEVLDHLWRAEHERTDEVLETLGHHHPDRKIAKAARRSLMKARSRG